MNRISKIKARIILIIMLVITIVISFIFYFEKEYERYYVKSLSEEGQELLNDYEFPWYMVENKKGVGYCLKPYDINDGVITFGPGVTYQTEAEGISDINSRYDTEYTLKNDCIDVDILFDLQEDILVSYESYVYNFLFLHKIKLNQNEFDALVLLAYNSPEFLKQKEVIEVLKEDLSKDEYIIAINNYYKQIDSYYDNPYEEGKDDGFGLGWYNRIVDSAEVFYDGEYEYQNNALDDLNKEK